MKVELSYTIPAPRETVWQGLLDPEILARCLPGCRKLEPNPDGSFRAEMLVSIGPVKGNFHGHVQILDAVPPEHFRLRVEARGTGGFVNGEATLTLSNGDAMSAVIHCAADAQVGGMMASVGQRLFSGAALKVSHQFFQAFQRELAARKSATFEATSTPQAISTPAPPSPEPAGVPVGPPASSEEPGHAEASSPDANSREI